MLRVLMHRRRVEALCPGSEHRATEEPWRSGYAVCAKSFETLPTICRSCIGFSNRSMPSNSGGISHRFDYDGINDNARRVLKNLTSVEREVRSRDARSDVMRMRPCRTIEGRIDGVVLTFFDITDRQQARCFAHRRRARSRAPFSLTPFTPEYLATRQLGPNQLAAQSMPRKLDEDDDLHFPLLEGLDLLAAYRLIHDDDLRQRLKNLVEAVAKDPKHQFAG